MLIKIVEEYLNSGRVDLFGQRVYSTQANQEGFIEVLLRHWEDGRLASPVFFIQDLEKHHCINILDRYVIAKTLDFIEENPQVPTCFVNVSSLSVTENGRFLGFIIRELKTRGISPERIGLEITERVLLGDNANVVSFIRGARELKIPISFDDFGVGMLRFQDVEHYKPSIIKIDGHFVQEALVSPFARAVAEGLISIGHAIGAKIVAEHVETQQIDALMREFGCDYLQGYYLDRPKPLREL